MAEADPYLKESEAEASVVPRRKRQWLKLALMFSMPLAMIAAGAIYWIGLQGKASTENAYVKQDKVTVSAEVTGLISEIFVKENQHVNAGQLLFRVDPEPYRLRLQQANAELAKAQADVTALANDAALSGADIAAAHDDIAFAQSNFERQKALWNRGFTTRADYDTAKHTVDQARASLRQAQADQAEARARLARGAAVPGTDPKIAAALAQRADAELSLAKTEVRAPMSGTIAQSDSMLKGQQLLPALPVVTIVGTDSTYIEANFKETDLADMRVGQRAKISIDAYGGLKLKGHVASIGAGTGSEFSILPAQNATGNWVKVTQRVPVRIAVDEKSPRPLIAGLSVYVTVYTAGDE